MEDKNKKRLRKAEESVVYGRVPPQNAEAEKAVIGQLLSGSSRITEVLEILTDETRFYKDAYQRIFKAICSAHAKGMKIDQVTIMTELMRTEELELVGGPFFLAKITENLALDYTIMNHCLAILEAYKRREAIRIGGELITQAYEPGDEVDTMLHETEQELLKVVVAGDSSDSVEAKDLIVSFNERLHKAKESKSEVTGINTGYHSMNALTSGWQGGNLIILAGRPSQGKTALALNFAMNCTFDQKPVGIFSLEMGKDELMNRLAASVAMVDLGNIYKGQTTADDDARLSEGLERIIRMPIHIDDTFSVSITQLRSRAKKMHRRYGIGMLFVDYLQLMNGTGKKGNREQEISEISRGLKGIAKELDIPVMALSQMSRDVEKRTDKEPQLSDLRESGAIEQDADIVMFVYHPTTADGVTKNAVKFAKNRNGALGICDDCTFFPKLQKWLNPSEANTYLGRDIFKPFAGMGSPDQRIEPKQKITDYGTSDDDDLPF